MITHRLYIACLFFFPREKGVWGQVQGFARAELPIAALVASLRGCLRVEEMMPVRKGKGMLLGGSTRYTACRDLSVFFFPFITLSRQGISQRHKSHIYFYKYLLRAHGVPDSACLQQPGILQREEVSPRSVLALPLVE